MSLKKKIALSFFISAFIIAILAAFEYLSFVEIRKEIRYLEITDYPTAAALSFVLMIIILVMVLVYARFVGTEALTGADEEA